MPAPRRSFVSPTLSTLLTHKTARRFLREDWERRVCHVERNDPYFFNALLRLEQLDQIVDSALLSYRITGPPPISSRMRLVETTSSGERSFEIPPLTNEWPTMSQIYREIDRGLTLAINRIDLRFAPVGRLCRTLEQELGYGFRGNLYVTPRGAQGFPAHYDATSALVLQLAGTKIWRLFEGIGAEFPITNDSGRFKNVDAAKAREVTLRPGDVLYVPRGLVHAARATSHLSMHLTVSVHVVTGLDIAVGAIQRAARRMVTLRQGFGGPAELRSEAAQADALRSALREIADQLEVSTICQELLRERAEDAPPVSEGHFAELCRERLRSTTVLYLRPGARPRVTASASAASIGYRRQTILSGPPEIATSLRFIASHSVFRVSEVPGPLSDRSKRTVLRRLLVAGLLSHRKPRAPLGGA